MANNWSDLPASDHDHAAWEPGPFIPGPFTPSPFRARVPCAGRVAAVWHSWVNVGWSIITVIRGRTERCAPASPWSRVRRARC